MISAVYQGQIYWGYLAQDSIWRWSGDGFDPVTPEELRALHGGKAAGRSDSFPLGFDNIDGRSMRALSQIRPEYKLTLDGQTVTMIFRGDTLPPTPLSLEVIRPGQGPQTIWSFDERPRRVSKEEYERDFQKP
jgi:hypothetical protein